MDEVLFIDARLLWGDVGSYQGQGGGLDTKVDVIDAIIDSLSLDWMIDKAANALDIFNIIEENGVYIMDCITG